MSESMGETTVESQYLSAGANRHAAVADWGETGLVAFGSDTNVCLWDPTVSCPSLFTPRKRLHSSCFRAREAYHTSFAVMLRMSGQ
jgi:hypothetical protein